MPETKKIIVQGVEFDATLPYAEGHVLTGPEARALNQTRLENLRNNFAPIVKLSKEGGEGAIPEADLPAKFAEYEAAYSFSNPGTGARQTLDPIEREARNIARDIIKAGLAEKGRTWNQVPDGSTKEEWEAKRDAEVERVAAIESVVKLARKNVESKRKSMAALAAEIGLGGAEGEQQAAE